MGRPIYTEEYPCPNWCRLQYRLIKIYAGPIMDHNSKISSRRDVLTLLFKYKYMILTVFLATVITVTVWSFLLPPVYEAKSSLMVKLGREHMYNPEVGGAKPSSFQSINQQEVISSELQILMSRDLIKKVITAIGVNKIYPDLVKGPPKRIKPLEAAILGFENNMFVENIKKSNVIVVSVQHKDPEIAASAVNLLVDFYKEKHLQVLSNPKSSFIERQLNTYKQQLEESENNFQAFKQKYKIVSLGEQRSLLLKQRVDLDTSLKTVQNRLNELEKILSFPEFLLTSQNARYFPQSDRYRVIDDAKSKLLSLQLREKELLGNYEEGSRHIGNIRKEIRLVQEFILEQEKNLVESELISLRSQRITMKSQLNQLDKEMKVLDLREKELLNLRREVEANESNYKVYLHKFEEARISDDLDRQKFANISVIQEAVAPVNPIKPKKGLNIALSIILGLLSGLGLAFFSEYLSQGLSTPESAQRRLGLPVLTTISDFNGVNKTGSTFLRWGLGTIAAFLLIAGILWVSPFKDNLLFRVENMSLLQTVQTTPDVSEIQKEAPALDEKLFATRGEQSASTMPETVVFKNDEGAEKNDFGMNIDDTQNADNEITNNDVVQVNYAEHMPGNKTVSVRVTTANIRTKPSINSNIMGQAFKSDQFLVLDEDKDDGNSQWYQVAYNGKEGWIAGWIVETDKILKSDKEFILTSMKEALDEEIVAAVVPTVEKPVLQRNIKNPWVVHLISSLSKDYAIGLVKEMKRDGNDAYVTRFKNKNRDWYRVRAGFFPTRDNALKTGKGLSEKYSLPDYWITKAPREEILAHKISTSNK
jgi:uncharacterized protein involved in exopolysaccharide biosynthesis/uncharacterized protein YgiM (DUF1202 family)